ncbi:DnaB-like helicase N-terminal domain-containing protein, partial [Acinetobacter baumannii]
MDGGAAFRRELPSILLLPVAQRKLDSSSLTLTPPQNNEAEMCALGAMMLSEAKLEILASSLEAEDFYVP